MRLAALLAILAGVAFAAFMAHRDDFAQPTPSPSITIQLGPCAAEDGNPDATACYWTDPDTGTIYVVDSSEYLD